MLEASVLRTSEAVEERKAVRVSSATQLLHRWKAISASVVQESLPFLESLLADRAVELGDQPLEECSDGNN